MLFGEFENVQGKPVGRRWSLKGLMWAIGVTPVAYFAILTGGFASAQGNVPSKKFFEDYMTNKARTFFEYRTRGIEPFLSMTLANNKAFKCITSAGREVDFEGYVEIYKYTFDSFDYKKISPSGVEIKQIKDDEILVIYTMDMEGKTRGALRWQVERNNRYTFQRIKADDTQKLRELNPQNLEKYFSEDEDKWIITRIEYE
jgi:hypothetical protein